MNLDHIAYSMADAWPVILFLCIGVAAVAYRVGKAQHK